MSASKHMIMENYIRTKHASSNGLSHKRETKNTIQIQMGVLWNQCQLFHSTSRNLSSLKPVQSLGNFYWTDWNLGLKYGTRIDSNLRWLLHTFIFMTIVFKEGSIQENRSEKQDSTKF